MNEWAVNRTCPIIDFHNVQNIVNFLYFQDFSNNNFIGNLHP
jgi:hypothetical protein